MSGSNFSGDFTLSFDPLRDSGLSAYFSLLRKIGRIPKGWIYRGQLLDYPLIPKAGRNGYYCPEYVDIANKMLPEGQAKIPYRQDLAIFERWKKDARAIVKEMDLPTNEFECLAYAQHYCLATRLLDWSDNALVALFFATENCNHIKTNEPGAVYALDYYNRITKDDTFKSVESVSVLHVPPFDRRIAAQSGCFTYHPVPNVELGVRSFEVRTLLTSASIYRIFIPQQLKKWLLEELASVGVSRKTLFPDLDGLSNFHNWQNFGRPSMVDMLDFT